VRREATLAPALCIPSPPRANHRALVRAEKQVLLAPLFGAMVPLCLLCSLLTTSFTGQSEEQGHPVRLQSGCVAQQKGSGIAARTAIRLDASLAVRDGLRTVLWQSLLIIPSSAVWFLSEAKGWNNKETELFK